MTIQFKHKAHSVYGCQTRRVGQAYLYTPGLRRLHGDKDLGRALGERIQDPPIPIDPAAWGISPQGVSIIQQGDYYHVFDWIGADSYPYPSDIWMQIIEKDDSALVRLTGDLSKLTEYESKRVLVHPRGWINNPQPLKENRIFLPYIGDCFLPEGEMRNFHTEVNDQMCSALWWQCVMEKPIDKEHPRLITQEVGDMTYSAARPIDGYIPNWEVAIIGNVPITELHLVVGNMNDNPQDVNKQIEEAIEFLTNTVYGLPLFLTDN
jgi:hypothetical protein